MTSIWNKIILIALVQLLDAVSHSRSRFKIESCQVTILNTADELVRLEHKRLHGELMIQQSGNFTQIQGRPIAPRTMNVYLPGNAETVIDYDCVSSYTRKMVAQIVDMENSVIVPSYSFKADNKYILKKHGRGYYYILRYRAQSNTQNEEMKRDKEKIQRLELALKDQQSALASAQNQMDEQKAALNELKSEKDAADR